MTQRNQALNQVLRLFSKEKEFRPKETKIEYSKLSLFEEEKNA